MKKPKSSRRYTYGSVVDFSTLLIDQPSDIPLPQAKPVGIRRLGKLRVDTLFLLSVITLVVFGLVMVYSASYDFSYLQNEGDATRIFERQVIWLLLGVAGLIFLTFWDYHRWHRLVVIVMGVTVLLLVGVLLVGDVRNNAARTLLAGSIQPSELAKLMTVVYLSVWLYSKRDKLSQVGFGLYPLVLMLGIVGGLIYLQPDLSALITILFLGGVMFFLAGGEIRQITALILGALLIGWLIVQVSPTGQDRIQKYLAGMRNPVQASYHVQRSVEAFVRGGWFGVGIGKAETKYTGLPVPPTDSIFAVVGEETGVFGALFLIVLYGVLLWRGMVISRNAPDQLGALLAAGLSLWIAFEAFINMAVMVNLLPFAGNALPFISAGGSNLVTSLAAVGIIMNISRLSESGRGEDWRFLSAVVSLRRWNRRRSVSRSSRPASPQRKR